VKQPA